MLFSGLQTRFNNLKANYADIAANGTITNDRYTEKLTYDQRGNINTLQRNGFNATNCTWAQIDNLTYNYGNYGYNPYNKVNSITDASDVSRGFVTQSNGSAYSYDADGNMTADPNKGITGISYNHLNLPTQITFSGNRVINFLYDASGNKLRKTVVNNGTMLYTQDYVNGIEYKNNALEAIYHSEGRVTNINGSLKYEYAMKDHLGNTRLMFCDKDNDGLITQATNQETSEVTQENSYYAFGMNMDFGAWENTPSIPDNLKGYNGKELNTDFGLNWNDYGARFYDPATARWNVMDPMAEKYKSLNPYNYVGNNPIKFFDPTGMTAETDYYNLNGKKVKHEEDGKNDKKLVLTDSKKDDKVNEAISSGAVIDVPSNEIVSKMEKSYTLTEDNDNGRERGFVVGNKGESSIIVEGSSEAINGDQWKPALNDLVSKGDLKSYDVHTHPLEKNKQGDIVSVGTPTPSRTDVITQSNGSNPKQPQVVLGYTQHLTPLNPGTLGGTQEVITDRSIGFYNSSGSLTGEKGMKFNEFKSLIKDINKK